MNRINHPLVAGAAPDANDQLAVIDSTPDGMVFITINRLSKKNAFDAATIAALREASRPCTAPTMCAPCSSAARAVCSARGRT